jgi:hypothetical protein
MHLVILAGLAIGSAVFSGCANGHSPSYYSGLQQKTPVKPGTTGLPECWVDWSKEQRSQKSP